MRFSCQINEDDKLNSKTDQDCDTHEIGGVLGLQVQFVEAVVETELDVHVGGVPWWNAAGEMSTEISIDVQHMNLLD